MSLRGVAPRRHDEAIFPLNGDITSLRLAMTLDRLYQPFIGDFPIGQIKGLPICSLDAKAPFTGTAPARHDLRDLVVNSLPGQGKRAFRIFRIGATFNRVHHATIKGRRYDRRHSTGERSRRLYRGLWPASRSRSDSAQHPESHNPLRGCFPVLRCL